MPSAPASSPPRTFTGTIALSGRGSSPRASVSSRSAPAASARQTSLTVPPATARTARTRSSSSAWRTSVRRGPMRAFSIEDGAGRSRSSLVVSAARRNVPAMRRAAEAGSPASRAAPRAARRVSSAPEATASAPRRTLPGAGSGFQRTGSVLTPGSGSASKSS